jgi:polysaccharide pyruvyl transferase WcaK-like protein
MPAALIVGAFGQDNPGDEALLDATVGAIRARAGWEPVVATARPAEAADRLDVEAVPAGDATTAWAAARTDALVVGGGTVFKELHPASGRRPGALLLAAAALTASIGARGKPIALVGVGAAPVRRASHLRLVRAIVRRSDLLVLRDEESARLLASMGVPTPLRVGADLAWLAPPFDGSVARTDVAPVGVALSHLAGDEDLIARVAGALEPLARAGHRVEVEPWQGSPRLGADARMARRLAAAVGPGAELVVPPVDLAEAVRRMAGRSVVLALRFHAAVAAAEAGTPFVAVTHEPKLAAIARRTGQRAVGPGASASSIAESLQQALLGPATDRQVVAAERQRARATVDLLGLLLEGGGTVDGLEHLDLVPDSVPA